MAQISISQINSAHISHLQDSTLQINTVETGTSQNSTSQNSFAKVGFVQIDHAQVGLDQIGSTEIYANKNILSGIIVQQVGNVQTNSTQINPSKISLPSSIALQQFFSSHNTSPTSIYDINNTALTLWNTSFYPTSPLNLNLVIKDLPTGQLAEAQITQFSNNGIPTGGTLYLDTDANGLGWYIDPTPWDNSEYSQTLTDTAYRATPDSLAYNHYDLLTTLLHETSHLQGFISGYSNYDNHIQTINGSKTPGLSEVEAFVGDGFDFAQPRRQPPQLIGLHLRPHEHHPHPRRAETPFRPRHPDPKHPSHPTTDRQ